MRVNPGVEHNSVKTDSHIYNQRTQFYKEVFPKEQLTLAMDSFLIYQWSHLSLSLTYTFHCNGA